MTRDTVVTSERPVTIRALMQWAFDTSKKSGWHDVPRTLVEEICLVHCELSEAVEEIRDGRDLGEIRYEKKRGSAEYRKPCGVPIEIADAVIRLFDLCAKHSIPLAEALYIKMEYNEKRPYRHGGKTL